MTLEGVVTNVTHFGAFVDIGVHQDGLVHISALSERFVKDPREVVKAGDLVQVKVMSVDIARQRVGLSMRLGDQAQEQEQNPRAARPPRGQTRKTAKAAPERSANNAFADLFANAKKLRK